MTGGRPAPDSLLHNEELVTDVAEQEHWTPPDWKTWERVKIWADELEAAGELTDLFVISNGELPSTAIGVATDPAGEVAKLSPEARTPILDAVAAVIATFRGPWISPDEERIAEIRRLFREHRYRMLGPSRLGAGKDLSEEVVWVARYFRKGHSDGASARGTGGTRLEAAENAWAQFQNEQR